MESFAISDQHTLKATMSLNCRTNIKIYNFTFFVGHENMPCKVDGSIMIYNYADIQGLFLFL